MDGNRFDEVTRVLTARGSSRRGALGAAVGAALAAVFGAVGPAEPAAAKKKGRCRNRPDLCGPNGSEASICGGGGACFCTRTVDGGKACVDLTGEQCPEANKCSKGNKCPGNQVCIDVEGCCEGQGGRLCVKKCGSGGGGTTASAKGGTPLLRQ